MLGRIGIWRHLVVVVTIAVCSLLALFGVIGGRGERFDAKQITVWPAGGEGVRIREVVDQDFGNARRHGYERNIPDDFGSPTDVTASSPDANADVGVSHPNIGETRIRLGDPDRTYTGQHRYVLEYTLPAAELSSGVLDLDIIDAGEEFETGRFEVVLTGFTFADTECNVGGSGDIGGCTLEEDDGTYRVVFEPLREGDGITVGGRIAGFTDPQLPELPPLPPKAPDHRVALALAMWPIGLVGAAIVYVVARRRGRNEVFAGGAVEAAYGNLPPPGTPGSRSVGLAPMGLGAASSTSWVTDAALGDLATIEFVPPRGLDPWHGSVLLRERIDERTVAAWFSALVASEAITLREDDGDLVLGIGRRRSELDPTNSEIVNQFMQGRAELRLGKYDPAFAAAWASVKRQQAATIKRAGWWKRRPPGVKIGGNPLAILVVLIVMVAIIGGSVLSAAVGLIRWLPLALLFGLVVPSIAALSVYARMLPARSATGSALTLMTESFRRFLVASEGRHVEWAWKQGILREYSAWAVALGAADAWGDALAKSNVPADERYASNPLLVHSFSRSFTSSHTAPSSSGSGGGGGGGGVGGGGGGGSSGSW